MSGQLRYSGSAYGRHRIGWVGLRAGLDVSEKITHLALARIERRFVDLPACSLVTVPSELCGYVCNLRIGFRFDSSTNRIVYVQTGLMLLPCRSMQLQLCYSVN